MYMACFLHKWFARHLKELIVPFHIDPALVYYRNVSIDHPLRSISCLLKGAISAIFWNTQEELCPYRWQKCYQHSEATSFYLFEGAGIFLKVTLSQQRVLTFIAFPLWVTNIADVMFATLITLCAKTPTGKSTASGEKSQESFKKMSQFKSWNIVHFLVQPTVAKNLYYHLGLGPRIASRLSILESSVMFIFWDLCTHRN